MMKSKQILYVIGITLCCIPLFSLAGNHPDKKKFQWNQISKKIDTLLQAELGINGPGGSIGVLYGNERVFQNAYGYCDIERQEENTIQTQFEISSVSKHMTAFAILLLEQEGKLKLDEPIGMYLPDLPDYKNKVSIRQLIQHTSGIASTDVLRLLVNSGFETPWSQEDEINMIKSYPQLNTPPNTIYNYSNSGYTLLAEIIEKTSNMPYFDYMKRSIFHPLSMNASYVFHSPEQAKKITTKGYKKKKDLFVPYKVNCEYTYGSTNIYSSLSDMLTWGKHILTNKLACKDYLSRISHPYNTLENGDTITATYGMNVSKYKGVKRVKHSGGNLGFRSQFAIYPEHNLCIVILLNTESINSSRLLNKICDIILSDDIVESIPKERNEIQVPVQVMKSYTGKFRMPDGTSVEIKLDADTLQLVLPGNETFRLYAESDKQFFLKAFDAQCLFEVDSKGEVNILIWQQGGKSYSAQRTHEMTPLTHDKLKEFAGNFYHEAFKVKYPISLDDNKLILSPPQSFKTYLNIGKTELEHLEEDKFHAGRIGIIQFERNEKGAVNAMTIKDLGRVKNFKLKRE